MVPGESTPRLREATVNNTTMQIMNNKHTRSKWAVTSAAALLLGALALALTFAISSLPAWAAAPQLKIALDHQGVTLNWPLPQGNWALESSATVAGRYAPVPQTATIEDGQCQVAMPATDQGQFFRLHQLSSQVEVFHQGQTLGGAPLHGMNGITKDAAGRLYIASVFGREIVVLNPADGAFIERLGPAQGVLFPDDVAFGPDGSLYWTDIAVG